MKQKLHKDLQALLDFYHRQRSDLPEIYGFASGVISNPSFFTLQDLHRHLNNPLLRTEWLHVILKGKRIELEKASFYKTVQGRQLDFIDKEGLNSAIGAGAAVVLEGIDILEPGINEFVTRLDGSLPCALCNSVVFFSQPQNEAYSGHCDADDVLVVQLGGRKTWQLFAPQQRRYADIQNQSDAQLGPVQQEFDLKPGDALYVRAGVPHRCKTSGNYSMHMAFDLCDTTPGPTEITGAATQEYRHACEPPYAPTGSVVERYVSILQSEEFQAALTEATELKRNDNRQFRELIGRASSLRGFGKLG